MNTNTLMSHIANQLPKQGLSMQWDIRGEIGSGEIDENKTLVAVCHVANQAEIVFGNFTYKLDCHLTGQILLNALEKEAIAAEADSLYDSLANYIKSLNYTDCDGAIVMEGTCGALMVETDNLYYTFTIPFTLFVQF